MRHRKNFNHLGRTSAHRKAMLSNMASSLIIHKRIRTTVAKAKALRVYVEPLITKSKDDSTHSRRVVFSHLQNKEAVSELFREISPKVADRPGGYTRILKLGNRFGDAAEMCYIELVDYNENMLVDAEDLKDTGKKRTRRSRGGKKTVASEAKAPSVVEEKQKETTSDKSKDESTVVVDDAESKADDSADISGNVETSADNVESAPDITDETEAGSDKDNKAEDATEAEKDEE